MEDALIPLVVCAMLFIGLPWLIFHYITRWKTAATLTTEDEDLLDELHDLARRLDDRMATIERIIQAENPNWRQLAFDPTGLGLEDRSAGRALEDERPRRRRQPQFEPDEELRGALFEPEGRSNQPRRRK